jgi:uncharacterized SAM-binding protein YcdF (DUF218 family)
MRDLRLCMTALRRALLRAGKMGARRILIIAGVALALWFVLAWVAAKALIVSAKLERADAIVVLSGSKVYAERARRAAELFREGRAPRVILTNDNQQSGWSEEQQSNPLFMQRAAAVLEEAGVPEASIEMLPQEVGSTFEEAQVMREYAASHNLRSILVVTSAYHSRRALWTWRRVFAGEPVEIGLDAVAPGEQTPVAATWWMRPSGWPLVAGEYFKLVYYWFHYR